MGLPLGVVICSDLATLLYKRSPNATFLKPLVIKYWLYVRIFESPYLVLRLSNFNTRNHVAISYFVIVSEGAKELMLHILAQEEVRAMESFSTSLLSLMTVLATEFKTNQVHTYIHNR